MAVKPTLYDDLELAIDPDTDVKATVKVNFSYRDSGPVCVDLSDEHAKEFDALMERYLAVATATTTSIAPRTRSNRSNSNGGLKVTDMTIAQKEEYRRWVQHTTGQPLRKYTTDDGTERGYKYIQSEVDAWQAAIAAKSDTPPNDTPPSDA